MDIAILTVRILLSLIFIVAAISKFIGGRADSRKMLTEFGVPVWLAGPFGIALPTAELVTGIMLIPQFSASHAAISALILLLIFNGAIAANLAFGRSPQCNCFGQLHSTPIGWKTLGRNIALAALAGWAAWQIPRHPQVSWLRIVREFNSKDITVVLLALFVLGLCCAVGYTILELFRQNGRLLLRIEALEARPLVGNQPATIRPAPFVGLPIGSKAIPFDLPNTRGSRATLDSLLGDGKPLLLISTDPNCGPCNSLMPDVTAWQKELAGDLKIALLSHGRFTDNQKKASEFGLQNVLVEKKHEIAEKYHALGTPTGVLIRSDSTIGSHPLGGAEAIRQLVASKAWTEAGYGEFINRRAAAQEAPLKAQSPKPALSMGSVAPPFMLPDLDQKSISAASFNGNATVLLFWNPACGYCQRMLPDLKQWETRKSTTAPRLMLISTGSADANRSMGLTSAVLLDDRFAVGQLYGSSGTPSGVLIDSKGKIASSLVVGAPGVMALLSSDAPPANIAEVVAVGADLSRAGVRNG
jgi:peroxiredoxin/uncharacterized membrane protein YphA (DoxX/SURF4 family)